MPVALGARLARALPNAALTVLPGAGHVPMWDQPRIFNRVLLDFFTPAPATTAPPAAPSSAA